MHSSQISELRTKAPAAKAGEAADAAQYLTFSLGEQSYAVGILVIKEIIQYEQMTAMPLMPSFVRGVINLRGAVVPVIDLYARFGRGAAPIGKRTCIVIIEVAHDGGSRDIGVMVDAVSAVIEISAAQIEAPPVFGDKSRTEFVAGMGKVDDRFVIILDVARAFAMDELIAFEESLSA